jgi:hypothetical protein
MNFHHDASFVFPKLTQVNLPSGRVYRVESGEHVGDVLPSITRILGSKAKPGLTAWKKRVGAEEAALVSARATVTGSSLHKVSECYLGNQELPRYFPTVAELWQRLRPWIDANVTCVYAQECDVFSHHLGAAGRLDLLAGFSDTIAVIDFKSSAKPKIEEWVEDYYLQGTFYACAVYEVTKRPIKKIVVPIVSPETIQVFETTPAAHFDALRSRIEDFYESYIALDTPTEVVV